MITHAKRHCTHACASACNVTAPEEEGYAGALTSWAGKAKKKQEKRASGLGAFARKMTAKMLNGDNDDNNDSFKKTNGRPSLSDLREKTAVSYIGITPATRRPIASMHRAPGLYFSSGSSAADDIDIDIDPPTPPHASTKPASRLALSLLSKLEVDDHEY